MRQFERKIRTLGTGQVAWLLGTNIKTVNRWAKAGIMSEAEITKQVSPEMERTAARREADEARVARWDLDIAIFLFAALIIVIILLFQGIGIQIIAPVAVFGLAMVWIVGWRRGKQFYQHFNNEKLEQELKKVIKSAVEETIEAQVQKALHQLGIEERS